MPPAATVDSTRERGAQARVDDSRRPRLSCVRRIPSGVAPSRWRSAAESLEFATLGSVVIAVGATMAAVLHPSSGRVWPEVLAVTERAQAAGLVLLLTLSSSPHVLRITHAVSQVPGADGLRYESAARRFERTAGLCRVIATYMVSEDPGEFFPPL